MRGFKGSGSSKMRPKYVAHPDVSDLRDWKFDLPDISFNSTLMLPVHQQTPRSIVDSRLDMEDMEEFLPIKGHSPGRVESEINTEYDNISTLLCASQPSVEESLHASSSSSHLAVADTFSPTVSYLSNDSVTSKLLSRLHWAPTRSEWDSLLESTEGLVSKRELEWRAGLEDLQEAAVPNLNNGIRMSDSQTRIRGSKVFRSRVPLYPAPVKSDPVEAGANMRRLWEADSFLTNQASRKADIPGYHAYLRENFDPYFDPSKPIGGPLRRPHPTTKQCGSSFARAGIGSRTRAERDGGRYR